MCGIAAIVTTPDQGIEAHIRTMVRALVHRGPDDEGIEILNEDGVALGARRLSMVDLAGGHQPMWDETRRYVVVFNGEIYNAPALRRELEDLGCRFTTSHSDTEVLVQGFRQWGAGLVPRLNGMFAFTIWDRERRRLFVARDRVGEKPLYYCRLPHGYALASEPRALMNCPGVGREVDFIALEQYLCFRFTLPPRTLARDIHKFPAASYAYVTPEGIDIRPYWRYRSRPRDWSWPELLEAFDAKLDQAVRSRLVSSDVPLGLFLSSGFDSNTVAWYMHRQGKEFDAFTIAFDAPGMLDERPTANVAMDRLGIRLHTARISGQDFLDALLRYADVLDDHIGLASGMSMYLVSRLASRVVKGAMCGDGSDELLMGYRQFALARLFRVASYLPGGLRRGFGALSRRMADLGMVNNRWTRGFEALSLPVEHRLLARLSESLNGRSVLSPEVRSQLNQSVMTDTEQALPDLRDGSVRPEDQAIAVYTQTFLPENMLLRLDRASMATSLEVRSPFLDPDLIDFLETVPASMKLCQGKGKYMLRRLMHDRLPTEVTGARKKTQFVPPKTYWLQTALKPLVLEYLSPQRLRKENIFDPGAVAQAIDQLMTRGLRTDTVWAILTFEMWRERWQEP